jgi:hypothetical protein
MEGQSVDGTCKILRWYFGGNDAVIRTKVRVSIPKIYPNSAIFNSNTYINQQDAHNSCD